MKRLLLLMGLCAVAGARAEITYRVEVLPENEILRVTMTLPKTEKGSRLQIPNWGPGGYVLRDGFKNVIGLKASDGNGHDLKIDTVMEILKKSYVVGTETRIAENSVCTWVVSPAKQTVIQYDIAVRPNDGVVHWGGPSTYLYETSRLKEKCKLEIRPPSGWPVYIGLDETKPNSNVFTAKNYDTLADNPVSTGACLVDTYITRGKPHYIVMRGAAKSRVDRAKLIKACQFVSEMQTDFFGGKAPYNKYIWHFDVNAALDGAGGLEHLSSTQISLAAGVGPRAVSVLSHEFFHLWNVKRIRSKPLGPFDYTKLPQTGALYWLEGVTDYYAHYLLYRYGWWEENTLFADIVSNFNAVRRNPAHDEISPFDSSWRVDETSNGRGNSNGYRISYYNQGWLVGMVLDIALRDKTNGKYSLDNVLLALWDKCRDDKPGFEEDEIRKQYVKFGGADMGPFFDRVVMKPGDMAIEETLAKAGLRLATIPESVVALSFEWDNAPGIREIKLTAVRPSSEDKLQIGDVITSVNGTSLPLVTGRALNRAFGELTQNLSATTAIKFGVKRGDQNLDVEVYPITIIRDTFGVERIPNATPAQIKIREGWMARVKAKP